ncbi:MAG TPA: hypothetical protein VFZ10_14655 [Geminicoccaceae bacterium]
MLRDRIRNHLELGFDCRSSAAPTLSCPPGTHQPACVARSADPPPRCGGTRTSPQGYRTKVEHLLEALADPAIRDEAFEILRGLIERAVVHPGDDGPQIELVGEIVRMVELGLDAKQAALPGEAACSVKVVAGARNHREFQLPPLLSAL